MRIPALLSATLCLVLTACGGTSTSPITPPGPGPTPTPSGDGRTPQPLNVQITPDGARTVEGTLTPAGGTLTATAADGTTFTLTAPENAVLSSLKVKMTPVEKLTGLNGAKGYLAAVHLEPEGTEFLEALTLKISAPQALDASKLRGFNSHDLGKEFYYQGRNVEGQTATLQLMHFSNPGVAELDDSDLIVPIPTDWRDRLENDLTWDSAVDQGLHLTSFYIRTKTELQAATINAAALKGAIRDFLTWRKEVERLGLSDSFKAQIYEGWTLVAQGIEGAVARAHAECVVNSDFGKVVDILGWISWVKHNPRLAPYFSGKLASFEQRAVDCARFELDFDFQMTEHTTEIDHGSGFMLDDVTSTHHVQAHVPVTYNLERGRLEGNAPTRTLEFTAKGHIGAIVNKFAGCPVTAGPVLDQGAYGIGFAVGGDQERDSEIPLVSLLVDPNGPAKELQTLTLVAFPGTVADTFHVQCPESTVDAGGAGDNVGWMGVFPELNDFPVKDGHWWYVPMEFQGGTATYRKEHAYDGPPLRQDQAYEGARMVIGGVTTLTMRHMPK